MSDILITALISAAAPTLAALAAWRKLGKDVAAVHVLVNSNMSEMQQKLMTAVAEIAELKQVIADIQPRRIPRRKR